MSDETTPAVPGTIVTSPSEYLGNLVREAVRDELMPLENGANVGNRLYEYLSGLRAQYQLTLLDAAMVNDVLWPSLRSAEATLSELSLHVGNIADRIRFHLAVDRRLTYGFVTEALAEGIANAYGLRDVPDVNAQRLPKYADLLAMLNGNGWLVAILLMDKYLPKVAHVVTLREVAARSSAREAV